MRNKVGIGFGFATAALIGAAFAADRPDVPRHLGLYLKPEGQGGREPSRPSDIGSVVLEERVLQARLNTLAKRISRLCEESPITEEIDKQIVDCVRRQEGFKKKLHDLQSSRDPSTR